MFELTEYKVAYISTANKWNTLHFERYIDQIIKSWSICEVFVSNTRKIFSNDYKFDIKANLALDLHVLIYSYTSIISDIEVFKIAVIKNENYPTTSGSSKNGANNPLQENMLRITTFIKV